MQHTALGCAVPAEANVVELLGERQTMSDHKQNASYKMWRVELTDQVDAWLELGDLATRQRLVAPALYCMCWTGDKSAVPLLSSRQPEFLGQT